MKASRTEVNTRVIYDNPKDIKYARILFHKFKKDEILHPSIEDMQRLIKKFDGNRRKIYEHLRDNLGYTQTRMKQ